METPKQNSNPPAIPWKRRLVSSAVISAALAFTLCLFGPLDLFFNNHEELWFHLGDILPGTLLVSLALFLVTTALGALLRGKLHQIYIALLFGGLLGTYVQGSFMNRNYGSLDGTAVDWSAYTGYGVVNTLVWLVCLLLPLVLMLVLKEKKVRPVLLFLSCALIVMQGASLAVSYVNYPKDQKNLSLTTEDMFTLSPDQENTVVIVLDTLDGAFMRQALVDIPELKDELGGFINYGNMLASGARTQVAMPLILTGIARTEPGSYAEYIDSIWSRQSVFRDFDAAGYDIRLLTETQFVSGNAMDQVDNLDITDTNVGDYKGLTKKMYKLTLYKYVPHFLKWRFWMYTGDFDKYMGDSAFVLDDAKFYKDYKKNGGFSYTCNSKSFRFYHLMGAHKPYNLTSHATRDPNGTSRGKQIRGTFKIVRQMLADMKEHGVYENTNIFIIADHGARRNLGNGVSGLCQFGSCLYKPAGASEGYTFTEAPVSMLDMTATLDAIAGGDYSKVGSGRLLTEVEEEETRTRKFYLRTGANATSVTGEYETTAHARDPEALQLVKEYQLTGSNSIPDYELGTELSFAGDQATANVYCTHGFRDAANETTHMEGRYGQIVIPIADPPETGSLEVSINFSSMMNLGKVNHGTTLVSVNGKTVYDKVIDQTFQEKKEIRFTVPVTDLKDGKLTIDFTFPDIPEEMEEEDEGARMQTLKLKNMTIYAVE